MNMALEKELLEVEFDLNPEVNSSRTKPGKIFRKKLRKKVSPEEIDDYVNSLLKGIDTIVKLEKDSDICAEAAYQIHSCQSENEFIRRFYGNVIEQLPNCATAVLYDNGFMRARAIVNYKTRTFTQAYGPWHYILEARFALAGFTFGDPYQGFLETTCQQVVQEMIQADWSSRQPRSKKIITEKVRVNHAPKIQEVEAQILHLEKKMKKARGKEWHELYNVRRSKECFLSALKKEQNKFIRACRVHGKSFNVPKIVFAIVQHLPAEKYMHLPVDHTALYDSSFYDDTKRKFVKVRVSIPAGFYKGDFITSARFDEYMPCEEEMEAA